MVEISIEGALGNYAEIAQIIQEVGLDAGQVLRIIAKYDLDRAALERAIVQQDRIAARIAEEAAEARRLAAARIERAGFIRENPIVLRPRDDPEIRVDRETARAEPPFLLFGRAAPALPPGDEACSRLGGQGAAMATMRESLIVPAGRPNWFQGLPGTRVNWTAGGWRFVNGEWVAPANGWLTLTNPGGLHYPHPAPTQPPPSIHPSVGPYLTGNWVWNNHTMTWQHLVDPSPSPDWPNWWQGPPGVNWTAGGWMFVNGEWVQPTDGWLTRANPGGVHYEHDAPTLAPPLEPGNWFWYIDPIYDNRWERWESWPTVRRRRRR
jgi:hypothetical protein